ncbi:MAG: YoaK family protein [Bacteriovoracaceae bacterium]|nr:YoaK family protein [Bacteriovoracaceae bacterium]
MLHVEVSDLYKKRYSMLWSVLSFKAGMINTAGFLIAGSYVSHVTGFGTQVGIALGHSDYSFGLELLVIPISFISGGVITSLILDKNYDKKKIPNYPLVQFLITFLLGIVSLFFYLEILDVKSIASNNENTIIAIGLLCLICGLKNGLTTWASHGKIRTTHLTGLSTDIGLHLPKMFYEKGSTLKSRYPESAKVNYVRLITLMSFSLGAFLAAILIPSIGYKIFYLIFFISLALFSISFFHRRLITNQLNDHSNPRVQLAGQTKPMSV